MNIDNKMDGNNLLIFNSLNSLNRMIKIIKRKDEAYYVGQYSLLFLREIV